MSGRDHWDEVESWLDEAMFPEKKNTITCLAGGEEMLRVSPDGFWVRGKRVRQDDKEAETVYNAFKAWMTWATLNKDYR